MVFMDDADAPGALAYHDLDSGLPIAKVFVKTTLAAKESLSVSASHELAEMLVDPGINEWAQAEDGSFVSYEACDPVEETSFMVNGFAMSDFVTPAYFQSWRAPGSVPFSYCNAVDRPFALEKGGYQITWRGGRQGERDALELVHGSGAKAARFALEDRRGHRSEYRRQLLGT